ncbi:hypothetical protein [Shimia aestuarii]|uniref:hypothetical protein n=1 Tax=Shimia aestuarii TaxID=254406 RepID=UPI000B8937EA|nr:hypothetical protein [Shimia aestuarii]
MPRATRPTPGQVIAATVDAGDEVGQRESTGTGSEIKGAQVLNILEKGQSAARLAPIATARAAEA